MRIVLLRCFSSFENVAAAFIHGSHIWPVSCKVGSEIRAEYPSMAATAPWERSKLRGNTYWWRNGTGIVGGGPHLAGRDRRAWGGVGMRVRLHGCDFICSEDAQRGGLIAEVWCRYTVTSSDLLVVGHETGVW